MYNFELKVHPNYQADYGPVLNVDANLLDKFPETRQLMKTIGRHASLFWLGACAFAESRKDASLGYHTKFDSARGAFGMQHGAAQDAKALFPLLPIYPRDKEHRRPPFTKSEGVADPLLQLRYCAAYSLKCLKNQATVVQTVLNKGWAVLHPDEEIHDIQKKLLAMKVSYQTGPYDKDGLLPGLDQKAQSKTVRMYANQLEHFLDNFRSPEFYAVNSRLPDFNNPYRSQWGLFKDRDEERGVLV